jgi:hypothetical protein
VINIPQIDLSKIENPIHRKLLAFYGKKMANTPLKTKFHQIPVHDMVETALDSRFDLTDYIFPELVYRYYFDSNFTCLIFGSRSDYKSACATYLALTCMEIAQIAEPDAFDFVVDSDSDLIDWYQKEKLPRFTTLIKDEWDKKMSGLGVHTMSETLANVIKRIRGRFINLIICTPEFTPYPVDFFFRTWEYVRFGNKCVKLLVYDEDQQLRGHCIFPMPTDAQFSKYQTRKEVFLQRTQTMAFTLDEQLINLAEDVIKDPLLPILIVGAKGQIQNKNKTARLTYIAMKYRGQMQSEALKKRVEEIATFLQSNHIEKFPSSTKPPIEK